VSNVVALFPTRDIVRSRRKHEQRAHTVSIRTLTKRELAVGAAEAGDIDVDAVRPTTRGDCVDGVRPCPFVSCIHNLYLDVNDQTGAIKLNFPDLEPGEMKHSCVLDVVAEFGSLTLEATGELLNVTRERIRQLEGKTLGRLNRNRDGKMLREFVDDDLSTLVRVNSSHGNRLEPKAVDHFGEEPEADASPDIEPGDERWELLGVRANRAYRERLIDRGFISRGSTADGAGERIAQIEENLRMQDEVRENVIAQYKGYLARGEEPDFKAIAAAVGLTGKRPATGIAHTLNYAEKHGLIPSRNGSARPKRKDVNAGPLVVAKRQRAPEKERPVATLERVGSGLLATLRAELERIDLIREKITDLVAELESA
jgi:hypothetical protein